jgi:uncharacterized membrane protein
MHTDLLMKTTMRPCATAAFSIGLCLLVLANAAACIFGQTTVQLQSTTLIIYRDGLVHCRQQLTSEALLPELTLALISEFPQNILLLDENGTTIDYKVVGNNITAYTLGAISLSVEYDTMQLTRKEAEVWTLFLNYPYNMTVFLPHNSTIVYLSEIPLAIETQDNTIALSLTSGSWEISYILPTVPPTTNPTNAPNNPEQTTNELRIEYIALIIIAFGLITVFGFVLYKKKRGPKASRILKENPQLSKEDQEVIQFLIEKDGKAFEAELREKFPNMPRTSLWRLVRRLERLDIVEIRKIGLENQVQLKK